MSFDRRWLEDSGSEDSHGRTLWALGECARERSQRPSRRRWASACSLEALPAAEVFTSPRAWAFTLLGLDAYCAAADATPDTSQSARPLAERLMAILSAVETPDWIWFEEGLAYDNARLPQALIVTGIATGKPAYVAAGLRSLRWLMTLQTTPAGCSGRSVRTSFGEEMRRAAAVRPAAAGSRGDDIRLPRGLARRRRSQVASRCRAGIRLVSRRQRSVDSAGRRETGSCRDGLHPDRANENRGGESVVSYLLGLTEIRELSRVGRPRDEAEGGPRIARLTLPTTSTTH